MALNKLNDLLKKEVRELMEKGTSKGKEKIIVKIIPPRQDKGPRYLLEGSGDKEYIKMNANSYLGLSMHPEVIKAEEKAALEYGVGPGAVRFISGTHKPHVELEKRLASFHGREACMILSSAYVTSMGVIVPLTTPETVVISDELNHNCIINALRLSRPAQKLIFRHNDMKDLEDKLKEAVGKGKRVLVITDGIFSMRGDHSPFKELTALCRAYDSRFEEGVISIADDSHGVGGFGKTGRGTEEYTGAKVDILIGTLGKAFGVNGGYVVSDQAVIDYFRETTPMYIYSNPITCSEAAAALKVLDILESSEGKKRLEHLRAMTSKFKEGLISLGYETLPGEHPVVPLLVRDTKKTADLVEYLTRNGVLATGLNYPVVPKGDEEIRFQVNGDHTEADIEAVLCILEQYKKEKCS
ncbi:MAG TPA: pyridoxal phosphate-dependent aminotransferase family protein [Candidatus Mcinerneyibacteriales bacterium]|nr:pyridoxal phosphate-dependent aminotransferase family protein [Candidatus Mcinerneyibacteriales bacterium]